MRTPGGHGGDFGEDLLGRGTIRGRPVAQLPVAVGTPSPKASVGLEGEAVRPPGGHGCDFGEDLLGRGTVRGRSVAQLPVAVRAPSPEAAITGDQQAIVISSGDTPLSVFDDPGLVGIAGTASTIGGAHPVEQIRRGGDGITKEDGISRYGSNGGPGALSTGLSLDLEFPFVVAPILPAEMNPRGGNGGGIEMCGCRRWWDQGRGRRLIRVG